jgi:quercetin dioxygenase-like cupin family protein
MKSIVPPHMAIPLHSHADPEVLFVLQGEMEVLKHVGDSGSWLTAKPGETICIPGDVKHAVRNGSPAPVTVLVATTPNVYGFFRELGRPFRPDAYESSLPSIIIGWLLQRKTQL